MRLSCPRSRRGGCETRQILLASQCPRSADSVASAAAVESSVEGRTMNERTRRGGGGMASILAVVLIASGLVALAGSPAHAAFPGSDGLIVFQSDRDGHAEIYTMEYLAGTSQTRLTNNAGGNSQ